MNLKQLQFAAHVADTGSFSRAAELSFVTQPTLSNAIANLEQTLGGRLFQRTTRQVELTPFGEYLLPRIRELLRSRDDLMAASEAYHNPSHQLLRIGFSPLVDMHRLDQVIKPFREANPEVVIFFKECFIDDLSERMQREQIDIKVVVQAGLGTHECAAPFYTDPLCYLPAHADERDPVQESCLLGELPDDPIILTGGGCGLNGALERLFSTSSSRLQPYPGQALSYKVIEDWAALGIGAGILPRSKITPSNRSVRPLFLDSSHAAGFSFEWVWLTERSSSPQLTPFLHYLQQL